MSTRARKVRKRAGVKFVHPVKVGTPFTERSWWLAPVQRPTGELRRRSEKKRQRALAARSEGAEQ